MKPSKSVEVKWRRSLSGASVDGKYIIERFVGAGKIGYVYEAERNDVPTAKVAVKLMFGPLRHGWDTELKKVANLQSIDGVVQFHDLGAATIVSGGESVPAQYTVWDYISPGENLKSHLSKTETISVSFMIAVVQQILKVLHACAVRGVARHGDLHSGNILVGDSSFGRLDDSLEPRLPIFVSDFGYGASHASVEPRDDYEGLSRIFNEMLGKMEYGRINGTDRQVVQEMRSALRKALLERSPNDRDRPLELLLTLRDIQRDAQKGSKRVMTAERGGTAGDTNGRERDQRLGQFQVSEMIGTQWEWWKRLFVPSVPARSKILSLDIPTVLTGPRGSGKTMLMRRLSERVVVECGPVEGVSYPRFLAFYVNANDFADAFARYPERPSVGDEERLICYANLCILSEILAVQSAQTASDGQTATAAFVDQVGRWLLGDSHPSLVEGEDRVERQRAVLEQIKWTFPGGRGDDSFPGWASLCQHRWLRRLFSMIAECCPWRDGRPIFLFVDDYSTPRIGHSMQRVLNRLLLQRSPEFLSKIATESASTFVPEDSSGKSLEDGDDYQLVDIGEESLFLPEAERNAFLNEVFTRRLRHDRRIPIGEMSLELLLGQMKVSKTDFARRLRTSRDGLSSGGPGAISGSSQRRGRSRGRVLYWGADVFVDLWSGDTRTMIQLIADLVDQASEAGGEATESGPLTIPIDGTHQDSVFRNRGGEWLTAHERNEPSRPHEVARLLAATESIEPGFGLCGEYGQHLKAIVEAFVTAARRLLLGPTYVIREGASKREVPRMAFRLEVIDEFRLDGLARELYRDLVRYGLFIRDSRGKSIRGTFVPRLFLRRLLIPYCALALSKRDSVPLTCEQFRLLLLKPDQFKDNFRIQPDPDGQLEFPMDVDVGQEGR